MTKRGGNGRRLTYRERWESLREWVRDPLGFELAYTEQWCHDRVGHGALGVARTTLVRQLDRLDHTTLVKARPVRPRLTRTRKRARL
jgi:hypothetical protein